MNTVLSMNCHVTWNVLLRNLGSFLSIDIVIIIINNKSQTRHSINLAVIVVFLINPLTTIVQHTAIIYILYIYTGLLVLLAELMPQRRHVNSMGLLTVLVSQRHSLRTFLMIKF